MVFAPSMGDVRNFHALNDATYRNPNLGKFSKAVVLTGTVGRYVCTCIACSSDGFSRGFVRGSGDFQSWFLLGMG